MKKQEELEKKVNRFTKIAAGILLLAVVAGFLVMVLTSRRKAEPEPTPTPAPTQAVQPTPAAPTDSRCTWGTSLLRSQPFWSRMCRMFRSAGPSAIRKRHPWMSAATAEPAPSQRRKPQGEMTSPWSARISPHPCPCSCGRNERKVMTEQLLQADRQIGYDTNRKPGRAYWAVPASCCGTASCFHSA